jgi:hypothetical protein
MAALDGAHALVRECHDFIDIQRAIRVLEVEGAASE